MVAPAPRPRLLCIDPGSSASGVVLLDLDIPSGPVVWAAKVENDYLVNALRWRFLDNGPERQPTYLSGPHVLVVEMIASYGMPVGAEVFETCVFIGRCLEAWSGPSSRVYRRDVKLTLCHSPKANDATIRQSILDRFGGKDRAVGRKATPGPLYGVKADCWSALAVGLTHAESNTAAHDAAKGGERA